MLPNKETTIKNEVRETNTLLQIRTKLCLMSLLFTLFTYFNNVALLFSHQPICYSNYGTSTYDVLTPRSSRHESTIKYHGVTANVRTWQGTIPKKKSVLNIIYCLYESVLNITYSFSSILECEPTWRGNEVNRSQSIFFSLSLWTWWECQLLSLIPNQSKMI